MKFIHTSDWHLGRQFHNVSLIDDQRAVLSQLIDVIQHHDIDAVIIAGDIYDRSVPPTVAIELLNEVVNQICNELNTPIILIPGNHDGAKRLGFAAQQMAESGLYIIADYQQMDHPVVLHSERAGAVAFYGVPYSDPEMVRNHYKTAVTTHDELHQFLCERIISGWDEDQHHVLISHCFVDGAFESESERPLSIGGSDRVDSQHFSPFDYVALGHLHQPQKKTHDYIRYSGSLMKYSFSEQHHKKGVTLVEFGPNGFESAVLIELSAPHQMRIIEGEMDFILEQGATDVHCHDYLLIRLTDQHAILDPMAKLRQVYPNVLHIEKPGMLIGADIEMGRAKLRRGELEMFKDFYLEVQQQPMSGEQVDIIQRVIGLIASKREE
jgi:DNA repair protein SbcD/Mre11